MECVFCAISAGKIQAPRVHEDPRALAFLDVHPLARGHTLVVPRLHVERLEDLEPDYARAVWSAVHRLVPAVQRAAGAPATTVAVNNGPEAGQEVPHVHIHIVPRGSWDGAGSIHTMFQQRPGVSKQDMETIAGEIRKQMSPR